MWGCLETSYPPAPAGLIPRWTWALQMLSRSPRIDFIHRRTRRNQNKTQQPKKNKHQHSSQQQQQPQPQTDKRVDQQNNINIILLYIYIREIIAGNAPGGSSGALTCSSGGIRSGKRGGWMGWADRDYGSYGRGRFDV